MSSGADYNDPKCQRFNESLDQDGDVFIAGYPFQRSRILFEMDPTLYESAFNDFAEEDYGSLKQVVFDEFPACIAYNLRLAERGEGSSDPVRKLLHMKDTWEAVIFVLYALVMGEIRYRGIDLTEARVFSHYDPSGNPQCKPFTSDMLLSDALKSKLHNIKGIIQFCKASKLGFKLEKIDETLPDDLLQLQDIRNDMSHHATPTREQAQTELVQVMPIFREMLFKTRFLEDCRVLRFESYSSQCRCEIFNGHSLNREFDNFSFQPPQISYILILGQEQLFVQWGDDCFSLSPFLHFERDASGHESYVCFYKKKKDSKYWYEPVKMRTEKTFDLLRDRMKTEIDVLLRLLKP